MCGEVYWLCVFVCSWGKFLEVSNKGPGLGSMSPCWRISVELFHV